jgi:hypothetical protein
MTTRGTLKSKPVIRVFPRIIFQVGTDRLPEEHYQSQLAIKSIYRSWEYHYYTELDTHDLIVNRYPRYLQLWDESKRNYRRRIAVCLWMYDHGGTYIDTAILPKSILHVRALTPKPDYDDNIGTVVIRTPITCTSLVIANSTANQLQWLDWIQEPSWLKISGDLDDSDFDKDTFWYVLNNIRYEEVDKHGYISLDDLRDNDSIDILSDFADTSPINRYSKRSYSYINRQAVTYIVLVALMILLVVILVIVLIVDGRKYRRFHEEVNNRDDLID